jgi:tetratricopeptide (TPR) repeat protein
MKRRTLSIAAAAAALSFSLACNPSPRPALAASAGAPAPCEAALAPGPETGEHDRTIAGLQQEARDNGSRVHGALERLGYAYVARARARNDAGDYTLAQATAACLDARYPGDTAALFLNGHVSHQLHRFQEAEQIARTLIARRTFVLDYGLLGDALMERGRLAEAATAYQQMLDLKPFYQSYTRAAHLRWLRGDLEGATSAIRLAIASASPRDPESAAWAWTRLATYELQSGRHDAALQAVDSAFRYQPDYAAARLTQGRILLAQRHVAKAIEALRQAAAANPLPEYQWTLADALRAGGDHAAAAAVEAELMAHGAASDPRTFALFLASRRTELPAALALVEEELRARADIFTLDAHAWALAASGRTADALPLIVRAVAEGTEDGRLFLHAGVIHAAAGQLVEARRWLAKAAQLRSMLLPSEADQLDRQLMELV